MSCEGERVVDHFCLLDVKRRPNLSLCPQLGQFRQPSRTFSSLIAQQPSLSTWPWEFVLFCAGERTGLQEFFKHGLACPSYLSFVFQAWAFFHSLAQRKASVVPSPRILAPGLFSPFRPLTATVPQASSNLHFDTSSEVVNYLFKPSSL